MAEKKATRDHCEKELSRNKAFRDKLLPEFKSLKNRKEVDMFHMFKVWEGWLFYR